MKRSKTIAGLLALILGVFGIHRFYLGQYIKGSFYILFPPLISFIVFYFTGATDVLKEYSTDLNVDFLNAIFFAPLPFYAPVLIIALIDAIIFFSMSKDRFNSKYCQEGENIKKNTVTSVIVFILCILAVYLLYTRFFIEQSVTVKGSDADYEMTAPELTAEFETNDSLAFIKYEKSIVTVTGVVIDEEISIATDQRSLILQGMEGYSVKCNFQASESELVNNIEINQLISVKGYVREYLNDQVYLEDCLLIEVLPGNEDKPVKADTINTKQDNLQVELDTLPR